MGISVRIKNVLITYILCPYGLSFVLLEIQHHDSYEAIGVPVGALSHTYGTRKLHVCTKM